MCLWKTEAAMLDLKQIITVQKGSQVSVCFNIFVCMWKEGLCDQFFKSCLSLSLSLFFARYNFDSFVNWQELSDLNFWGKTLKYITVFFKNEVN